MLGMPSNQAKDAIAYTPRAVLLKARKSDTAPGDAGGTTGILIGTLRWTEARRAHKGVTSVPRMVPGQVDSVVTEDATEAVTERQSKEEKGSKRRQSEGADAMQDGGQIKRKKVKGDLARRYQ